MGGNPVIDRNYSIVLDFYITLVFVISRDSGVNIVLLCGSISEGYLSLGNFT